MDGWMDGYPARARASLVSSLKKERKKKKGNIFESFLFRYTDLLPVEKSFVGGSSGESL